MLSSAAIYCYITEFKKHENQPPWSSANGFSMQHPFAGKNVAVKLGFLQRKQKKKKQLYISGLNT